MKGKKARLRVVHRRLAEKTDAQTDVDVKHAIGFYSTVLAGVNDENKIMMHGSGTLVTVDGRGVFLTAHHVVYGKGTKLGLVHFPGWCMWISRYGQQPIYDRSLFVPVSIAKPTLRAGEPDLGAVLLPDNVVADCKTNEKSFYSLDTRPVIEPEDVAAKDGALMVTAGAPIEYTDVTPQGRVSVFLLGHGRTMSVTRRHGYTFISLGVSYGPGANPPRTFEGMSGGGLWIVPVTVAKGSAARVRGSATLIGVIFRQVARNNKVTSVRCHGSRDIYELARTEIAKAIKNQPLWKGLVRQAP